MLAFPIVVLSLLAPAPIETGRATFTPSAAEAAVPALFRLDGATFDYQMQRLRVTTGYTVWSVRFPSPIVTADPENNIVPAEYFRPNRPGRRNGVVVLHILGADFALSRFVCARLADGGVAALFVKLPYYGERRPTGGRQRFLSGDVERSIGSMRQGVLDIRRAASWLAGRPEIEPTTLGVTGISLGGILASLAAAIDPAIGRAALLLAGGDLHEILWAMPEGAPYRKLWTDSGRTLADLRTLTTPYDPLTYAARLKGKRVLMFAGNVDEVIPPASARALWHAAGEPPIVWLDCGHYSAAGFLLPVIRDTVAFFQAGP